jgi:hypothetical protein
MGFSPWDPRIQAGFEFEKGPFHPGAAFYMVDDGNSLSTFDVAGLRSAALGRLRPVADLSESQVRRENW